jgi:ubiquinone/menaquinone biosynthesis C-methylase UbiE
LKRTTSFDHIAEDWDKKTGDKGSSMISAVRVTGKNIISELGTLKNKRVYEIACGNGFLARQLAPKVKEMRASDISAKLIDFAKNKYESKKIKYEVRDAVDFKGIPKNHFDAVIIHQGIFYIQDMEKLAKGVNNILKKGGVLIFSNMHPLMYIADTDAHSRFKLKDLIERYRLYLKNREILVTKRWMVGKKIKKAEYYQFKRPLSFYINAFGNNGLPIVKIIEPPTINMIHNKIVKSPIPASLIVKCQKI